MIFTSNFSLRVMYLSCKSRRTPISLKFRSNHYDSSLSFRIKSIKNLQSKVVWRWNKHFIIDRFNQWMQKNKSSLPRMDLLEKWKFANVSILLTIKSHNKSILSWNFPTINFLSCCCYAPVVLLCFSCYCRERDRNYLNSSGIWPNVAEQIDKYTNAVCHLILWISSIYGHM